MATTIPQYPKYSLQPATFSWVFVLKNDAIVSGNPVPYWNVSFSSNIFIGNVYADVNTLASSTFVARTKTIPNNAGVGVFNFERYLQNSVEPQQLGYFDSTRASTYKNAPASADFNFPIHIIDRWSLNDKALMFNKRNYVLNGATQSNLPATGIVGSTKNDSGTYAHFNGYVPNGTPLVKSAGSPNFGFNINNNKPNTGVYGLLSDAPLTQYAGANDYGTFSCLNRALLTSSQIKSVVFIYTFADGTTTTNFMPAQNAFGGVSVQTTPIPNGNESILYCGIFPANLRSSQSGFAGYLTQTNSLVSYTFQLNDATSGGGAMLSVKHKIVMNCKSREGFEPIRITWLNSWGGWDYYTFNMKSTTSLKTKRNDWQQNVGTWNKEYYNLYGNRGGKKAFTVNATKNYKVNTDFVSEEDAEMFEFMMNSPEVYILHPYDENEVSNRFIIEKYITAVRLTSSSFTRKTRANDKLIQYSFKFEDSRTQQTQPS